MNDHAETLETLLTYNASRIVILTDKECEALRAAIALMRGQSEPVADAAGKDAFLALADSLDCFWNASLGATHPYDDATANAVMSGMVQGFAAVAFRLREHAANKTEGRSR